MGYCKKLFLVNGGLPVLLDFILLYFFYLKLICCIFVSVNVLKMLREFLAYYYLNYNINYEEKFFITGMFAIGVRFLFG